MLLRFSSLDETDILSTYTIEGTYREPISNMVNLLILAALVTLASGCYNMATVTCYTLDCDCNSIYSCPYGDCCSATEPFGDCLEENCEEQKRCTREVNGHIGVVCRTRVTNCK